MSKLFCDRSISWRIATAVRELGFEVQTLAERYGEQQGQLVADVRWIAEAARDGYVLLGADGRIRRNPAERRMLCLSAARYLVYPNNNISTVEKLARIQDHRAAIEAAAEIPGPWVRHLTARELTPVALDRDSV
ncbi:hypothetical protein [Kutzneria sp. 744]|uniref:PIN-like domain-containing protein n=1 Tax=Kutzneria sp. (strain 744) TaxID=345341 RepID=UPI0003EEB07E|nr:hypothetical protein [Kutzneria sp. 744]EWM14974.1 toxin-antitoxin system, toxin component, PIN family [Kutzneria sp. 744]